VLESDLAYLKFANEQSHYRRLESLDAVARAKNLLLLTGAGAILALSTPMVMQAAERLPDIEKVEIYDGQGRAPDAESGFASFMGFALELSILDRPCEAHHGLA
jgi:hypothetical protein